MIYREVHFKCHICTIILIMRLQILSQLQVTTDELVECRLSKREQKRMLRIRTSIVTVRGLIGSNPNKSDLQDALSEIGKVSRHAEIGAEEATTAKVRRLMSDSVLLTSELKVLLQHDLDNMGILSRISSGIKTSIAFFLLS